MKILSKINVRGVSGDPSVIEGALDVPTEINLKTINGNSLIGTDNLEITVPNLTLTTLTLGNYQLKFDDVSDKLQVIYTI